MSQDAKKDEFRKYLEKAGRCFDTNFVHILIPGNASQDSETNIFSGVLELLTKSLVQLYEVGRAPLPSEL